MPDLLHIPPEQREQAMREFLATSQHRQADVDFLVGILNPEADMALLALLEELAPKEFTQTANTQ